MSKSQRKLSQKTNNCLKYKEKMPEAQKMMRDMDS